MTAQLAIHYEINNNNNSQNYVKWRFKLMWF